MILKDKIYINKKELNDNLKDLCDLFIYNNPEFYQLKKLKLSTNGTLEKLYHYYFDGIIAEFPRGGLYKIKEFYKERKIPFRVVDERVSHETIDVNLIDTKPSDNQYKICEVIKESETALIQASPGMGKSISILLTISEIKQPTLILLHEHRLASQWKDEIEKRLEGTFNLGELSGDKKEHGDITIGLIQTVHKLYAEDPDQFNKYGMVIVDESHRASSDTYLKVLNNLNAKYRVGVTGTVKRKDSKEILAYDIFGKILLDIQEKDLKERITNFEFQMINTNIEFEIPTVTRWAGGKRQSVIDYTKTITNIVNDEDRNNLIFYHIQKSIQDGYFPLVLSDRVSHNEFFYNKLIENGYKSVLIIGKTRKKVKWDEVVNDETLQCVVANTSIASEGLDLPRLSALFLTTPSSNAPKLKQRIGRIRRTYPNKLKPKVFDFVDNLAYATTDSGKNYMLKYTGKNRSKVYIELIENYSQ